MNDTGVATLVDTDRNELRDRIGEARRRFYQLARTADPNARRRGLDWTVHQVIAHVLCVAHRYQAVIEGRDFRRAVKPCDLDPSTTKRWWRRWRRSLNYSKSSKRSNR
jgi:uncharacterized damage-inducible protein DinB